MKAIDLGGTWRVTSKDGAFAFDGSVPGSFFRELEESGHWGAHDVSWRENNRQCLDLARRDIEYTRLVSLDGEFLESGDRVFLECDGLDTLAKITVNHAVLAETDNMHVAWRFDVTDFLHEGENRIAIEFANTLEEIDRRARDRTCWMITSPVANANLLRKNFCSFGWDWGPQIPDIGIYRPIRLTACSGARLNNLQITQHHEGRVRLDLKAEVESWSDADLEWVCELHHPGSEVETLRGKVGDALEFTLTDPHLWWPRGYGSQPLYRICATLLKDGKVIDELEKRIGLRTIEIDQTPDEWGTRFAICINGLSIFACGANYIPEDLYLSRVTPEKTRHLLEQAAAANFNCLRVWGGGIYPSDAFFDACDELGLLIWQDLMFACALYDVRNPEFQESITAEISSNMNRLRHHASLALICGNNEMEWAFTDWGMPHTDDIKEEYLLQYEELIPTVLKDAAPGIPYWPASPSSSGGFDAPNDPDRGDVHFWAVWHGRQHYTEFRKHHFRFLSEFGFQSFPSIKTVKSFTEPEDRNIFSAVMEDHQRNDRENGNGKILHYISENYRYPKDFEAVLYVSQCSQAEALRYAVEHLRQNRGRCMGATYWQFNDIWPVTSWSSIDSFGRWKGAHYMARRVYGPVLLSIREEGATAAIFLTNETWDRTEGTLTWKLVDQAGQIADEGVVEITVDPFTASRLLNLDFTEKLTGTANRELYLVVAYQPDEGPVPPNARAFFARTKHLELRGPELEVSVSEAADCFEISVTAKALARFLTFDLTEADVIFSDNFFDLDAGETRVITAPKQGLGLEAFRNVLRWTSIWDSY